jgi:hypothetical protein
MIRLPNWQSSLERFFRAHAADRSMYGSWDCCLFVCSAIEAMTGIGAVGKKSVRVSQGSISD